MRIDVGVYTPFIVDLEDYDFHDCSKVVFTVKNVPDIGAPVIIEREYTESRRYDDAISPEESLLIRRGATYDFNEISKDGKRYKISENQSITLRRGCGQCQI